MINGDYTAKVSNAMRETRRQYMQERANALEQQAGQMLQGDVNALKRQVAETRVMPALATECAGRRLDVAAAGD